MSKIEEMLNQFVEITKDSIISLEEGNLETTELYIKKREKIIEELKLLEYTKDEFKNIVDKISLVQVDMKLQKLLKENIASVKDEMREFRTSKEAYINYNKFAGKMPTFINQKI